MRFVIILFFTLTFSFCSAETTPKKTMVYVDSTTRADAEGARACEALNKQIEKECNAYQTQWSKGGKDPVAKTIRIPQKEYIGETGGVDLMYPSIIEKKQQVKRKARSEAKINLLLACDIQQGKVRPDYEFIPTTRTYVTMRKLLKNQVESATICARRIDVKESFKGKCDQCKEGVHTLSLLLSPGASKDLDAIACTKSSGNKVSICREDSDKIPKLLEQRVKESFDAAKRGASDVLQKTFDPKEKRVVPNEDQGIIQCIGSEKGYESCRKSNNVEIRK